MASKYGTWERSQFGQCAVLVRDTCSPEEAREAPYIGLEHIEEGGLRLRGHGKGADVTSLKSRFERGDILFGKLRPYFRKVILAPFDGVCSTDIWVVRARRGIEQRFLFYWMASRDFVEAATRGSEGTKMPRAKWEFLSRIEANVPPLGEQREIAHILGTLDDKIELNRRMNETLEAMARALFKSWFVDFDPVRAKAEGRPPPGMDADTAALFPSSFQDSTLGKIPKGWRASQIGDVVEAVGGSTPSTTEVSYWNGTVNFATPKDMASLQSPVLLDAERQITEAGLRQISSGLLPKGIVLLSSRAPIGYLAIAEIPVAVNQGIIGMKCEKELPNLYVLYWAKENLDTIVANANGTTFLEISKKNFRPIQLAVPPPAIVARFMKAVEPLYRHVVNNLTQSKTLASIRDALLPKLLSGEVRAATFER